MGWEYAERLKEFLLERRYKTLKERGLDPKKRKLVVCWFPLVEHRNLLACRYGPLHEGDRTIPLCRLSNRRVLYFHLWAAAPLLQVGTRRVSVRRRTWVLLSRQKIRIPMWRSSISMHARQQRQEMLAERQRQEKLLKKELMERITTMISHLRWWRLLRNRKCRR